MRSTAILVGWSAQVGRCSLVDVRILFYIIYSTYLWRCVEIFQRASVMFSLKISFSTTRVIEGSSWLYIHQRSQAQHSDVVPNNSIPKPQFSNNKAMLGMSSPDLLHVDAWFEGWLCCWTKSAAFSWYMALPYNYTIPKSSIVVHPWSLT